MLRAGLLTLAVALLAACDGIGIPTPTPAPALTVGRPAQAAVKVAPATAPQPSPPTVVAAATVPGPLSTRVPTLVAPATATATVAAPPAAIASPTTALAAAPPPVAPIASPTLAGPPPLAAAPATKPAEPAASLAEPTATIALPTASPTPAPPSPSSTPTALPATATPTVSPTTTVSPTVTITPVPSQIGQRFVSGPVALTVFNVAKGTASAGNVRVIAEVQLENLGQTAMGFGPAYFKLYVGSGGPSSPYTAGAQGTDMPSALRPAGILARANVAFEVPIEARGLVLAYEPQPPPQGYTVIKVGLGE